MEKSRLSTTCSRLATGARHSPRVVGKGRQNESEKEIEGLSKVSHKCLSEEPKTSGVSTNGERIIDAQTVEPWTPPKPNPLKGAASEPR